MKYPQLVSTRAVNAISDWLVSRLEQLGVEAPLIYSRLLLSLLHSSVQINDPIEFNNLETYLSNRKGSKRIPPCDTETIKKITAVQCLMDAVSSEQEITKVEHLVDELCEKLSDIENQTNNEEELHQIPQTLKSVDIEDPRKRYYRAFPALSKEMEDSVWLSKRNTKALTWPNGNTGTSSSSMSALCNTAGVKRKQKRRRNQAISKGKTVNIRKNSFGGSGSPTWDTDFEGSWEMGRDLIKEFIVKQNNRNRSTSESDACNIRIDDNFENHLKPMDEDKDIYYSLSQSETDLKSETNVDVSLEDEISSDLTLHKFPLGNICSITDDGYSTNDVLNSKSEPDCSSNMARRLYEREISNDSINLLPSSEQHDFAQFAAKFNSSVEALWNDDNNQISNPPNHQNLENFWTNYYNHHYDTEKFGKSNNTNNTIELKNDFFSMPTNLGKFDDPSTNNINPKNTTENNFVVPAGMFLRDPVWSDKPQKIYEEDDSFYAKVLGSTYNSNGKNDNLYEAKDPSYSFNISKWSECTFETPFIPSSSTSSSIEKFGRGAKNDLRENMLRNSYLYNYKQPVAPASTNLNIIIDNNQTAPFSLPEFYGSVEVLSDKSSNNESITETSEVSLPNHSRNSGFVVYSSIKSSLKLEPIPKVNIIDDQPKVVDSVVVSPNAAEEENLLTSELTHFRPIKQTYADGHQFEISNNIDDIEFERSDSGYLYLDSEKYLEYQSGEDILTTDDGASCLQNIDEKNKSKKFSLKFRLKQNEIGCQTDDLITEGYILRPQVRNVNHNKSDEKNKKYFIESKELEDSECLIKDGGAANVDLWSMAEIGKKCLDNSNSHTLWGLCSACSDYNESVPASRLLKDELDHEGDEIMSELKYMQNLYIGSDWEDDEENDTDGDTEMIKDCELYQPLESNDEDDDQVFYNVTKLITDLLKPENAKSLADALGANKNKNLFRGIYVDERKTSAESNCDGNIDNKTNIIWKNANTSNNEIYPGGLWNTDEDTIWKEKPKGPIDDVTWTHMHDIQSTSFLEELTWDHTNLAEIWNNKTSTNLSEEPKDIGGDNIDSDVDDDDNNDDDNDNDDDDDCMQQQEHQEDFESNLKHIENDEISNKNMKNLISSNISSPTRNIDNVVTRKDLDVILHHHNINDNEKKNQKCITRFDRKRRHSASQNVNTINTIGYNCINDFCDIIGNKIEVMSSKRDMDFSNLTSDNDTPTIITCKWTTIDASESSSPPYFMDKSSHYDGICAMAMNPSSILKHVAVVSRPLTR